MIEKFTSRIASIFKKDSEGLGTRVVQKIKNSLVRSPKTDCFVSVPKELTPELSAKSELSKYFADLKSKDGSFCFLLTEADRLASYADTPEKAELAKILASAVDKDGDPRFYFYNIEATLSDIKIPEQASLAKTLAQLVNKDGEPIFEGYSIERLLCCFEDPKEIKVAEELAEKLAKIDGQDADRIGPILTAAETKYQANLAFNLAKAVYKNGSQRFQTDDIKSFVFNSDTPIKARMTNQLSKIFDKNGAPALYIHDFKRIIDSVKTPADAKLVLNLAKILDKDGHFLLQFEDIKKIVQASKTEKDGIIKTDLVKTLSTIGSDYGVRPLSSSQFGVIVPVINTQLQADLLNKLLPEFIEGRSPIFDLKNILQLVKIPEQADLVVRLSSVINADGRCKLSHAEILQILRNAETKEKCQFKGDMVETLFKLVNKKGGQRLDFSIIADITGFATTKESAKLISRLVSVLSKKERLTDYNIKMIVAINTLPERARAVIEMTHDKEFLRRIKPLDKPIGDVLYAERLATRREPDIERINKLYTFLKDNKINLQQHGEEKITNEKIAKLFDSTSFRMMDALDLLDDGVIKYAAKLKFSKFKKFITGVTNLEKNLTTEDFSKLKENLPKLTKPEQKLDRLQSIIALVDGDMGNDALRRAVDMLESPRTTVQQINFADKIFTSSKPYQEQVEEFLTKFKVPTERKDKMVSFLEKAKLNEKVIVENNTQNKTLTKSAKQELAQQIEAHINVVHNNHKFNKFINYQTYKVAGIDTTPELLSSLSYDKEYLSNLLTAVTDSDFKYEFEKLVELIKTAPSKPMSELRETLEHNIETKSLFEANGINYSKWTQFDKNSILPFSCETNLQEAIKGVELNIVNEVNGDLFKSVDKKETGKILKALSDVGYKISSESITKNGETVNQKDLEKIVDVFKDTINSNGKFWDKPLSDAKAENLKNELVDHLLKGRKKEVADLASMANTKMDLIMRLTDDNDIGRNLFLGHHVGCCTSVDGINGFAAPQHLMNSFVRAIEIVDKGGNSYGNSMCYFAKVDDKLSFVVDSFEANGKLGGNQAVTDAIVDYAKQVTKEMGKPDIPIYFGPNYNKISMAKLENTSSHKIEIIGKVEDATYIDAIGGNEEINVAHLDRDLYALK